MYPGDAAFASPFRKERKERKQLWSIDTLRNLAELRSTACSLEAVLLTLFHARIAGQEPGGLQGAAVVLVHHEQGAGDAVTDGAGLAGHAAAGDGRFDVDLADGAGGDQGLADDELQGLETKMNDRIQEMK